MESTYEEKDLTPEMAAIMNQGTPEKADEGSAAAAEKDAGMQENTAAGLLAEEQQTDFDKALKEKTGLSIDEIQKAIEVSKSYDPEKQNGYDSIRAEYEALVSELEQMDLGDFASEDIARLNQLQKTDPKKAGEFAKVMYGGMSHVDLLRLQLETTLPGVDVKEQLEAKYGDYLGEDADPDSSEYKKAKAALVMDAELARKAFLENFRKVEIQKGKFSKEKIEEIKSKSEQRNKELSQQRQQKIVSQWKPNFANLVKEAAKVEVEITDPDTKKNSVFIEEEIPADKMKEYQEFAANHILKSGMEYDEKSSKIVKKMIRDMYILDTLPSIIQKAVAKATKGKTEEMRDELFNGKLSEKDTQTYQPDDDSMAAVLDKAGKFISS
jgi:hypothetical protein